MDMNEIDFKSNQEKVREKETKKVKKRTKLKKGIIQNIFCILSILFIVICCIYYGKRLIKYYKIYNPKGSSDNTVYMAQSILSETPFVTDGDGAYRLSGNVIYKGEDVNNYVEFSNQLWRILKVRSDNSIELILDDYINIMPWNNVYTNYEKSDIYSYLNNVYIKSLNKSLLTTSSVCTDSITSTTKITCDNLSINNYVNLLDVSSYLNSIQDGKTFISLENNKIWLLNGNSSSKKVWNTSGSSITTSDSTSLYMIKPMITISSTSILDGGDGTKTNPYKVKEENKEIMVGSYVKLDDDVYRVFDINDKVIKLELNSLSKKSYTYGKNNKFDADVSGSLAYYLNNTYLNSLSYKDKLVSTKWYVGEYTKSYKDTENDSIEAYVGILNMSDIKFGSSLLNYYLSTPVNEKLHIYNTVLAESKTSVSRPFRPAVAIKKNEKLSGSGTSSDPFVLED